MNPRPFHLPALRRIAAVLLAVNVLWMTPPRTAAADANSEPDTKSLASALPPAKWQRVEISVDRSLAWLATQQRADGSFAGSDVGQPATTSLAVLAYLSRGHHPGVGPYGQRLNRAIDYVLQTQQPDGLFTRLPIAHMHMTYQPSHAATYNHAIAGLMLGEVFGQVNGERANLVRDAIRKAIDFTRQLQTRRKNEFDRGGIRYTSIHGASDADISVTAWHLMFLRSAKNAEFEIPNDYVDDAIGFVRRCWNPQDGMFFYNLQFGRGASASRGMTGAGILSLSLAGQHQTPMALASGDWLVAHPFRVYGQTIGPHDRFFYSTYYCSQAAAQLGGYYWEKFFPPLVDVLLEAQNPDGSWPVETGSGGGSNALWGNAYSSSLAILSLTPPYQLLPVYQR